MTQEQRDQLLMSVPDRFKGSIQARLNVLTGWVEAHTRAAELPRIGKELLGISGGSHQVAIADYTNPYLNYPENPERALTEEDRQLLKIIQERMQPRLVREDPESRIRVYATNSPGVDIITSQWGTGKEQAKGSVLVDRVTNVGFSLRDPNKPTALLNTAPTSNPNIKLGNPIYPISRPTAQK